MKPAPFEYFAPETVDEAIGLLGEYGDEATVLAGGQSLIPMMNLRLARPAVLVDINGVRGLERVELNGIASIGAIARHQHLEESAPLATAIPVLRQSLRHVGHAAIRSRGTIGGSIAHADPAAELPAVLLALDGEVTAKGPNGERRISAADLVTGMFTTSLAAGEVLTTIHIPRQPWTGSACVELSRRHGDFALAGSIVIAGVDDAGSFLGARIVVFGVESKPFRATEAERFLVGRRTDDLEAIAEAAELATSHLRPFGDDRVPSSYRKRAAAVLVRRGLVQAVEAGANA